MTTTFLLQEDDVSHLLLEELSGALLLEIGRLATATPTASKPVSSTVGAS